MNVDQGATVSKSHLQPYSRTKIESGSGDGDGDDLGKEAQEDVEDPLDTLALWGMCLDQTGQFLIQQNRLQEAEEMFTKAWVGRPKEIKHESTNSYYYDRKWLYNCMVKTMNKRLSYKIP